MTIKDLDGKHPLVVRIMATNFRNRKEPEVTIPWDPDRKVDHDQPYVIMKLDAFERVLQELHELRDRDGDSRLPRN